MIRIGSIGSSLIAAAAAAALASVASITGPEPAYPHRGKKPKPKKKQRAKKPRTANVLGTRRPDDVRERMKANERATADAAIPDKYLHSAERRRRQAEREAK